MVNLKSGAEALPDPEVVFAAEMGKALGNIAGALGETQVMMVGENIAGWVGESADAFTGEAVYIKNKIMEVQNVLTNAIKALDNYQQAYVQLKAAIQTHQRNWDELISWYYQEITRQEETVGGVVKASMNASLPNGSGSVKAGVAKLQSDLASFQAIEAAAYNRTVESMDAHAATTASSLKAALDMVIPTTDANGTRYVPSRSIIGVSMFGNTNGVLSAQTRWTDAKTKAPDAIALLNQIDSNTGLPTETATKEFNQKYGNLMATDPYFATLVMREVGTEKLYQMALQIIGMYNGHNSSHFAQLKTFVENIGAGLILTTGGASKTDSNTTSGFNSVSHALLFDDKKSVLKWRSDFQSALIEHGKNWFNYQKEYSNDSESSTADKARGYALLGQYIGYGARKYPELSLGDSFLNGIEGKNSVAKAMVLWDAKNPEAILANNTMTGRASDLTHGKSGLFRDNSSWDCLQNMYEAMNNAPDKEPSQRFMNSVISVDTDLDESTPNKKMTITRYLVGNRTQLNDVGFGGDSIGGPRNAIHWPDDRGKALGCLIDEISGDTSNPNSVNVAREFIRGYCDGLKKNHDIQQLGNQDRTYGQDVYGYHHSGLRSYADDILKEYMGDIAHETDDFTGVEGGPAASWDPKDKRYHLVLDEDLYRELDSKSGNFFESLSWDKKVLTNMATETVNQMAGEYYKALTASGENANLSDLRQSVVNNYAGLLEKIDNGEVRADAAAGRSDKTRSSIVKGILNIAAGHINPVPSSSPVVNGVAPYIKDGIGFVLGLDLSDSEAKAEADRLAKTTKNDVTIQSKLNELKNKIYHGNTSESFQVERLPTRLGKDEMNKVILYNNQLPENERFLNGKGEFNYDSNGKTIVFNNKAQEQAYRRFTLNLWYGMGTSKDTQNN